MFSQARAPRYAYHSAVVQWLPADQAERVMGSYLTCEGIHLPSDPSPRKLPSEVRDFWDKTRENAQSYYRDDKIAKKTAWKTTRLFYRDDGNGKYLGRDSALPTPGMGPVTYIGDPGDLVGLGVCIEYTYIWRNANGIPHLGICKFPTEDPPSLYWSPQTASLYVFPGTDPGPCMQPDPWSTPAHVFKTWSQRDPQCQRVVDVPEVDLQLIGNLDTIVYRDDKWHDYNPDPAKTGSQEYIHQFGDGVGLWQSPGDPPGAIVMTGGCLELDPRGLIH